MRMALRLFLLVALGLSLEFAATAGAAKLPRGGQTARIAYVIDGDTVALTNGRHVRLVQIDMPEVYYSPECYGEQASRITTRFSARRDSDLRGVRVDIRSEKHRRSHLRDSVTCSWSKPTPARCLRRR